jgi:hypothetical protein
MTVGMFMDRLERFRQGVLLYREIYNRDILPTKSRPDFTDSSDLEALRDKLRQQFSLLEEYVAAFSQGRYQIHLDSRGLQDIYVQAFSEEGREWHLEIILKDLEHMLADLQKQPLHQPLMLHNRGKDRQKANPQRSFGSLGHLGNSSAFTQPASLHAVLSMVGYILHRRIDRSEDEEKLQTHLKAIIDHHEMADLLPLPPSRLL